MSYSLCSMSHLAIHLDFSGLARICLIGLSHPDYEVNWNLPLFSFSSRTTLILSVEAVRYITKTLPLIGAVSVSNISMNSFIFQKASSALAVYCRVFSPVQFLSTLKNGSGLSDPFERNLLRAANFSLRVCISLGVLHRFRSVIALTFEGLALIPCLVMRCPKNGPSSTPKERFFGLSFILMKRSLLKVSLIPINMSSSDALSTTISSAYASRIPALVSSSTSLQAASFCSRANPRLGYCANSLRGVELYCYMNYRHYDTHLMHSYPSKEEIVGRIRSDNHEV
ncbi:hypothetical protein Tco_0919314 [Tanacetum coccineum]